MAVTTSSLALPPPPSPTSYPSPNLASRHSKFIYSYCLNFQAREVANGMAGRNPPGRTPAESVLCVECQAWVFNQPLDLSSNNETIIPRRVHSVCPMHNQMFSVHSGPVCCIVLEVFGSRDRTVRPAATGGEAVAEIVYRYHQQQGHPSNCHHPSVDND